MKPHIITQFHQEKAEVLREKLTLKAPTCKSHMRSDTYATHGLKHVTTLAASMDAVEMHLFTSDLCGLTERQTPSLQFSNLHRFKEESKNRKEESR